MTSMVGGGSLQLRLVLFAALAINALLGLSGIALALLFERQVETYAVGELNTHFEELASRLAFTADGTLTSESSLSDPRFEQPQGGLYWQVDEFGAPPAATPLRSRSMWDEVFSVPTPPEGEDENHAHTLPGPGGLEVLALEKLVILPKVDGGESRLVVTVAMQRDRVANAISGFRQSLIAGLAALYFALLAATFLMIHFGLRPLKALQALVQDLRTAKASRILGAHPSEVQPLVSELNTLVEAREKQLDRARQRAGNLAHGLKTPLTVLSSVAGELTHVKQKQAAANIMLAVGQMRDLVDRELARSRMALADSGHRSALYPRVERVVETLRRAPKGDALDWRIEVPDTVQVAMDPTDLLELLGNLIDNARKHARKLVRIVHTGDTLVVEDDGPGVPDEKLSTISRRGVKLDALSPGSGLGLSIVSDLAEVYDFDVHFSRSDLGGLKAAIGLPALP
jgi:signal transduction histidine kinase